MHRALLAVVHPVNAPHGANLTFAIPIIFFVVVTAALFVRFRAPHAVPGHVALESSRWATGSESGKAAFGEDSVHAAVGTVAEPETEASGGSEEQTQAPGTVQSGTTAAPGQARPASEGPEEDE